MSETFDRRDVEFQVPGSRYAGWLYLQSARDAKTPCAVMADGTTGTTEFALADEIAFLIEHLQPRSSGPR